jgi:2-polyprenyl-3-methyl-5-hydroxy-6-metoxy-1,4-benzoquinol methylase
MLYERYLESIRGDRFRLDDELAYAKILFQTFYAPPIPGDTSARILEVGCGFGKVLWAARECGFTNIEGVDISDDQIAFGRSTLGLPLEKCDALERLTTLRGELDAILAIDVLEHCDLEYSISLVRSARNALRPRGVLIAQVPNGLSPLTPTFHGDVTHVRAFSAMSLAQLFRFGDFKSFKIHSAPPVSHGVASAARRLLWAGLLNPLIRAYLMIACGSSMGGIYTPNIIGIASNES